MVGLWALLQNNENKLHDSHFKKLAVDSDQSINYFIKFTFFRSFLYC